MPLTIRLTMVDAANGGKPRPGTVVYLWHCNQDGEYSMYGQDISEENYLRGVQVADANGVVTFTSIYPGRVLRSMAAHPLRDVRRASTRRRTARTTSRSRSSRCPADPSNAVYKTAGYEQSASNLSRTSLATDNVFSDGVSLQTPIISGDATNGYTAAMAVGV